MAEKGQSLTKLPHGVLNDFVRDQVYESYNVATDDFFGIIDKMLRRSLGPNFSIVNRTFNGVCIDILKPSAAQKLMASGHNFLAFQKISKTTSKTNFKAIRVYIPEIHSDRALPDSILSPSKKDKKLMEAMFPIFISRTEKVGKQKIKVGDIVEVQIKNALGSGVYLHKIEEGNSTVSAWVEKGGKISKDSFRCDIIKRSKVITNNENRLSAGTLITDEATSEDIDAATLKQQYIKYLYEKERKFMPDIKDANGAITKGGLKSIWNKATFKKALGEAVGEVGIGIDKKLMWGLMYSSCGHLASGLSVGGNIVKSVESIDDNYGIFRYSKEYFDAQKDIFAQDKLNLLGADSDHSMLLDPAFSMKFFIIDFLKYFKEQGLSIAPGVLDALNLDKLQKEQIVAYFELDAQKISFLFPEPGNKFKAEAGDYDVTTTAGAADYKTISNKIKDDTDFEAWLIAKSAGIPVETEGAGSTPPSETSAVNPQGSTKNNPPSTPEDCQKKPGHKNYPPRSTYLIHVDAQKKMVREFLNSEASGLDLEFTKSEHIGLKSIKMGNLKIPTPFKVLRFDNESPLYADNQKWFNANSSYNLVSNKRYLQNYYRNPSQILDFLVGTLGNNDNKQLFYKDTLEVVYSLQKPMPHFIVSPNGQVIQLIDAAAVIESGFPTTTTGIIACFGEGPGHLYPIIEGTTLLGKPNHILAVGSKNFNSWIYRYHKLGTKAALQSMQKLIEFFIPKTKIEYNLAAIDGKLLPNHVNKSNIQAAGQYKGVSGMNFIYYAWTLGLAYFNNGRNILLEEEL